MDRAAAFKEFCETAVPFHNTDEALAIFINKYPEPKPFDYIGQALCTKSDKFFGGNVALVDLERAMGDFIVAGNKLDAIKKALFYGKPYPKTDERYNRDCGRIADGWMTPIERGGNGQLWEQSQAIDIIHAIIGKATEAVEGMELLATTIKTKLFDTINAKEETFDGQWYDAILCNAIGITFEDGQRNNIDKLRKRFEKDGKFTEYDALNRDLTAEREVLEVRNIPHIMNSNSAYFTKQQAALSAAMPASPTAAQQAELAGAMGETAIGEPIMPEPEPEPSRKRAFIGSSPAAPVISDADFLRSVAQHMTYNDAPSEAVMKHRLIEIAVKLERLEKV